MILKPQNLYRSSLYPLVSNKSNSDFSDERRLVSALKKGQEEAFRFLVQRYQKKLFSIAYGIT
ncbi:MAG: hypothetical protein AMK69_28795, partial [Nitrospira bacterium SG8_3]